MRGRAFGRLGVGLTTVITVATVGGAGAGATTYGTPQPVGSGWQDVEAVAADGSGDLFAAEYDTGQIIEVPAGGGPSVTVASGFSNPNGVAVDSSGDLFVSEIGHERVVEVPAGGGPQKIIASGLNAPIAVAVDAAGDVFVAEYWGNQVDEYPAGGGQPRTVGSGLVNPVGVAVDSADDVFITDRGHQRVVEVPAGGGAQQTVASGFQDPIGVTVDSQGDVFVADNVAGDLDEIAPGGAATVIGSGYKDVVGVAANSAGDLFVNDPTATNQVVEYSPAGPSSVTVTCDQQWRAGDPSVCYGTVTPSVLTDGNATGTLTFSADAAGVFSNGGSCVVDGGSCGLRYTPSSYGSGTQTITIRYSGDATDLPSSGNADITLSPDITQTFIDCGRQAGVGVTRSCTVAVGDESDRGNTPTGIVSLSADGAGSLSTDACPLSNHSCSFTYTPTAPGSQTLTAVYPGDAADEGSSTTLTIEAGSIASGVLVLCERPTKAQLYLLRHHDLVKILCHIKVKRVGPKPTGIASFTVSPGTASPTRNSCPLGGHRHNSRCQFEVETRVPDDYAVAATYNGDGNYAASSDQTDIDLSNG